jgi:hypothetical protein
LFGSVGDFLPANVGMMPCFLAVETLVVSHKFCTFLGVMSLSGADFICDDCVNIHGVSSLGGGAASSSSLMALVFHSKGLVEASTRVWSVGSSFLPFAMLFLCFFGPFFEGPGCEGIIGVGGYDGVKKSPFESKFELFDGTVLGKW